MKNQMKFSFIGGEMRKVETIDFKELKVGNISIDDLCKPKKIIGKMSSGTDKYSENSDIVDSFELKYAWNKIKKDWFTIGEKETTLAVGILWTAFVTYIFPWFLDVAKVYCAFMIAQGFYRENKGIGNKDGRTGFQSFIYYGKWLVAFHLIPVGVELLDAIGSKMLIDIKSNPVNVSQ